MAKATGTGTAKSLVETRDPDEFATILKQSFKPRSERAATEVENAVTTLVQQALADTAVIKDDVLDTIEEMIARLDEKLSAQMNEILHARGVPADRKRLARPALPRLQLRDGLQPEDPRDERLEERALPQPAALSRRALGPEPAVQGGLRSRVRPARRRAVRLPDRRLSFQPPADRRAAAARPQQGRRRGARAVLRRRRSDAARHGQLDRARQSARHRQDLRHAGLRGLEAAARLRTIRIYVGLCMPRVLARLPYGAKSEPVEEFAFEEDTDGHKGEKYALDERRLCDGGEHQPRLQGIWLVHAHPRRAVGRRGDQPADPHLPDR